MANFQYRWKSKKLREHVSVINGDIPPTIVLQNATYLNVHVNAWLKANIWVYEDRIVYVGDELPSKTKGAEIVDCSSFFIVPGYIEPHVHPFQLYNPHSFAQYASQSGTTTIVNDNLMLALHLTKKKAFTFLDEMKKSPVTMYWWCRFDAQTEIRNEEEIFTTSNIKSWLDHETVIQGGELTCWPKVVAGDDIVLHWMQEAKRRNKPIEGHLPGASEKTLVKMKLLGVDSDHEAMTGSDVKKRILQGYTTPLRYSSIRPDLPTILEELEQSDFHYYDQSFFTTDGSPPSFYQGGIIDRLIAIALEQGVDPINAYKMASFNAAKHFKVEHIHGSVSTGRIANLNILTDINNPTPLAVLANGKWVKKEGKLVESAFAQVNWDMLGLSKLNLDWDLCMDDLQFSMALGLSMVNDVILKPYSVLVDVSGEELAIDDDQSFLMLMDRHGKWRINTIIQGFDRGIGGLVSSYSNTGDIVIIGKNKNDMIVAFSRMKELGGGMVLVENGEVITEIPLPLDGVMSQKNLEELIVEEENMRSELFARGYSFTDPIYTLLFLSSTHLPYIRITPRGIYDVMNKTVLFPSIMR
ncbi:adenine deaminase C-terminal domain-containing protein [Sutcliffiella cohnii]